MLELRIGILLGLRQIQRANFWTNALIIVVIMFTFINLIAVSGILLGIVESAVGETRHEAVGDIIVKALPDEERVLHTEEILRVLKTYPAIVAASARYTGLATIEANYKDREINEEPDAISALITGVDPTAEKTATDISSRIKEGSYFSPNETGYIILGKYTIDRYADKFGDAFESLSNVYPGDTVRVTVGDNTEEFIVKGIIDSKVDIASLRIYLPEREFRRLFARADTNAEEIIIRLKDSTQEEMVKQQLLSSGIGSYATFETFTESTPKFIADVQETFSILGIFVGAIGITVASITIFIVVFINALSRKRQIGILKAIGITERTIEYAYVTQAGFYALVGSLLGVLCTVYILIPYFIEHPIDFPYSYASLSITTEGILYRSGTLFFVTLIAGFVPAWMIVRQNTLDSILGRK